jgi:hypothetical protein
VLIEKKYGTPIVCNDGVTIARVFAAFGMLTPVAGAVVQELIDLVRY